METFGRLLTPEERQQTNAHFCKNSGIQWDLHTIAQYIRQGSDAIDQDDVTRAAIEEGISALRLAAGHD